MDERIRGLEVALQVIWPTLSPWLDEELNAYMVRLIDKDDPDARGAIKFIRRFKELPEQLRREAIAAQMPQQEDSLT